MDPHSSSHATLKCIPDYTLFEGSRLAEIIAFETELAVNLAVCTQAARFLLCFGAAAFGAEHEYSFLRIRRAARTVTALGVVIGCAYTEILSAVL